MNKAAVDAGLTALVKLDIPADWANRRGRPASPAAGKSDRADVQTYLDTVMLPAAAMEGDDADQSSRLMPSVDGTLPAGTAAYEKRGIAVDRARVGQRQVHSVQPVLLWSAPTPSSVPGSG